MEENHQIQKVEPQTPVPATPQIDAQSLITLALERNVPVETIERLTELAMRVKAENARESFNLSLAAFQAGCPIIKKWRAVKGRSGAVMYHFANLKDIGKQIGPVLREFGFSYRFTTEEAPNAVRAICILTHAAGHSETAAFTAPIDPAPAMGKTQAAASARSYAKRMALSDVTGLLTTDEDDDGIAASGMNNATEETVHRPKPQTKPVGTPASPETKRRLWALISAAGVDLAGAQQNLQDGDLMEETETIATLTDERMQQIVRYIEENADWRSKCGKETFY